MLTGKELKDCVGSGTAPCYVGKDAFVSGGQGFWGRVFCGDTRGGSISWSIWGGFGELFGMILGALCAAGAVSGGSDIGPAILDLGNHAE